MNLKNPKLTVFLMIAAIASSVCCYSIPASKKDKSKNQKDKSLKILTIGDSNGALPFGWVYQLKQIRPYDTIFNISISGNTIGYNNLGRSSLNTLANIRDYMSKAYDRLGTIDRILIMIGTNDCKAVFKDSLFAVPGNMKKLITEIRSSARSHKERPRIYIISPPPFGPDELVGEKYAGGMDRITLLNKQLQKIAEEESVNYINTCDILYPVFRHLTTDGVHLNADGQRMIALIIQENLKH